MYKDHPGKDASLEQAETATDSLRLQREVVARVRDVRPVSDSRHDTLLHTIIRNMQEVVLLLDRDLALVELSKTAIDLLVMSADFEHLRFTPDVNADRMTGPEGNVIEFDQSPPMRVLQGEQLDNEPIIWKFDDGSRRHFIVNGTPVFGADGNVDLVLLVARDVTELRELQLRTEKVVSELSSSQRNLRRLVDNMAVGVIFLDSQLRVIQANRAYAREFGSTVRLRKRMHIEEALPQARECGMVDLLNTALQSERPVRVKCFRYDGLSCGTTYWNGSAVPVRIRTEKGLELSLAVVLVDVTDEIQARDQLSEIANLRAKRARELEAEKTRLNTIIESTPIPLAVIDTTGRVVTCNAAALAHAEMIGASDWMRGLVPRRQAGFKMVAPDGSEIGPGFTPIARSLRGEVCTAQLASIKAKGLPSRTVLMSSSPLKDVEDQVAGVILALQDITDYVNAQSHQRDIAEKLQQSLLFEKLPAIAGFEIGDSHLFSEDEDFIGGDFYDIFRIDDNRTGIAIADVAGKGLKAAVYTSMAKYMLRAYALENWRPDLVLARLNQALMECTPAEVFVTLIYGVIDSSTRVFRYANAGHEQPVLMCKGHRSAYSLNVTGRALALVHGSTYSACEVEMNPGDVLVLYTDGVTDAGSGIDRFGVDSLLRLTESRACLSPRDLANAVIQAAEERWAEHRRDDAAVVVIKAVEGETEK